MQRLLDAKLGRELECGVILDPVCSGSGSPKRPEQCWGDGVPAVTMNNLRYIEFVQVLDRKRNFKTVKLLSD